MKTRSLASGHVLRHLKVVRCPPFKCPTALDSFRATAGFFLALAAALTLNAQVANDNFADRISLSGTYVVTEGLNIGASREPGEPGADSSERPPFENSVWWSWVAPADGLVVISTASEEFYTTLAVYTGNTLASLNEIAYDRGLIGCSTVSRVAFPVTAGTAYGIAVGGQSTSPVFGECCDFFSLELVFLLRPANDGFANRIYLGTSHVRTNGTNIGASREPNEPDPGVLRTYCEKPANKSVWWSWTAPTSGPVTVAIRAERPDIEFFGDSSVRLNIYTGDALTNLAVVATRETHEGSAQFFREESSAFLICQLTFDAEAAVIYQIAVDGAWGSSGRYPLNVAPTALPIVILTQPANGTVVLSGSPVSLVAEAYDPDGTVRQVNFYRGSGSYFLQFLGAVTNWPFNLIWSNPTPSDYNNGLIAVASDDLGAADLAIPVALEFRPSNDAFANRIPLSGSFATVTGSDFGATREPGEPPGNMGSVWWSWTAPISGPVSMWISSFFALGIYTGSAVSNLTQIAFANPDPVYGPSCFPTRVSFVASAGTAYHIALSGSSVSVTGTLSYATAEPYEGIRLGGHSIWWTWVAPQSGPVTCTLYAPYSFGSPDSSLYFYVFTGTNVSDLAYVAFISGRGEFDAVRGTTYILGLGYPGRDDGSYPYILQVAQSKPSSVSILGPTNEARGSSKAQILRSLWTSLTAMARSRGLITTFLPPCCPPRPILLLLSH